MATTRAVKITLKDTLEGRWGVGGDCEIDVFCLLNPSSKGYASWESSSPEAPECRSYTVTGAIAYSIVNGKRADRLPYSWVQSLLGDDSKAIEAELMALGEL